MSKKADEAMKQRLLAERDRLLKQRDALDNQIAGLERGIALMDQDEKEIALVPQGRGRVKTLIIDLLREVGTTGLTATYAVELAKNRNIELSKESISSLLSRLKKDEVVTFDGDRYRLSEFSRSKSVVDFSERLRVGA